MNLTNYHSHCSFCDGRAPLEDFIQEAIGQGFTSYGVSSHAPLPFPTNWAMKQKDVDSYLKECNRLKVKYSSRIEFYTGMEIDYLDEQNNPSIPFFRDLPLDYRIGSVHLLYDDNGEIVDIDCSPDKYKIIVDKHFYGDIKKITLQYYNRLTRMIESGGFDIVGHADKMHYNASQYHPGIQDEDWYQILMNDYFGLIAEKGYMVEINTKAYRQLGTFFPNIRHFKLLKEYGIPLLVNSDAHYPERINDGRPEALRALRNTGITTVKELHNGNWVEVPIG